MELVPLPQQGFNYECENDGNWYLNLSHHLTGLWIVSVSHALIVGDFMFVFTPG